MGENKNKTERGKRKGKIYNRMGIKEMCDIQSVQRRWKSMNEQCAGVVGGKVAHIGRLAGVDLRVISP